jgi:hypothetical protein
MRTNVSQLGVKSLVQALRLAIREDIHADMIGNVGLGWEHSADCRFWGVRFGPSLD